MDISKSKILLKKINALHESGINISSGLSALERDLLLQYLREYYEVIQNSNTSGQDIESREMFNGNSEHHMHIAQHTPQETLHYQTPIQNHHPTPSIPTQATTITVPSPPQYHAPVSSIAVPVAPVINPPAQEKLQIDPQIEELFDISSSNGTRFSLPPIIDINKALSINERILTINELFGGSQPSFSTVSENLNRFVSFEEAKEYLAKEIAPKYDWTSTAKRAKAQQFIQLVKRRYT